MKRFTFILTALFAATFANAQITLDSNIVGSLYGIGSNMKYLTSYGENYCAPIGNYFLTMDPNNYLNLYDGDNLSLIQSFDYNNMMNTNLSGVPLFLSQGIFTTDNRWACLLCGKNYNIVAEDGSILLTLTNVANQGGDLSRTYTNQFFLVKIGTTYKLIVHLNDGSYNVYSLPGKGEPTNVSNPAPKRSVRKIAREGQVLVETENNTFDLRGQEVK